MLMLALETEREFIKQHQREGIDAAKAKGIHCGRYEKQRPENYEAIFLQWQRGELSGRQASALLCVAHTTFQRWAKKDRRTEILQDDQIE